MMEVLAGRARVAVLALAALVLAACGLSEDDTPDYRYRLTVEVDTPQGLKTGSSVIEVRQMMVRPGSNPAGRAMTFRTRGEAVAVDIAPGRTLFALLRSENDVDWAARVMLLLAPKIEGEPFAQQFDNMLLLDGEIELPRTWPPAGHLEERSAYPMLVTFGGLSDPTSVEKVDPDDLTASFGEGVNLKRIIVQLTDEAVTTGIEERLNWLEESIGSIVSRPRGMPIGEMPIERRLNKGDFRRKGF